MCARVRRSFAEQTDERLQQQAVELRREFEAEAQRLTGEKDKEIEELKRSVVEKTRELEREQVN